jgi:hypothetical protein
VKIDALPLSARLKLTEAIKVAVKDDKKLTAAAVVSTVAPLLDALKVSAADADALITNVVAGFKDGSTVDPEVHKLFGAASAGFELGNAHSKDVALLLDDAASRLENYDKAGALGKLESAAMLAPAGAQRDAITQAADAARDSIEAYRRADQIVAEYNARIGTYDMTLGFENEAAAELGREKNEAANPYTRRGNELLEQAGKLLQVAREVVAG